MMSQLPTFSARIEAAVGEIEANTDAEIVVVVAERSGSYRDLGYIAASALSLLALVGLFYAPWEFHPLGVSIELGLFWAITAYLLGNSGLLVRIAGEARRRRQVDLAAAAEFLEEVVHATPHRSGVLIYVSHQERAVTVLPDLGIPGKIPQGTWAPLARRFPHDDLEGFVAALRDLGALLARLLPKLEVDEVDLPNAPRVRQ